MQYDLTEEQKMLRTAVRDWAEKELSDGVRQRDEIGDFEKAGGWELVGKLREQGFLCPDFPVEYGGPDMGLLSTVIIVEELSRVECSTGLLVVDHDLSALPIMLTHANKAVRDKYLPKLSTGEWLCAFGLTETSGGSDVAGFTTRAERKGDEYVINGNKIFITQGGVAPLVTVYCITDKEKGPYKGASVIAVEKGTPGFTVGKHEDKMGVRWSDTSELIFDDCRVPAENLCGQEGQGFAIMMKTLDFSRPPVAAMAMGIAQGAFDCALDYSKQRIVFGKPIINHEALAFKLVDMWMEIEAARQLLYKACAVLQECPKDMSRLGPEEIRYSSASKIFVTDMAMRVATEAVQVVGGYGYCKDYPVEQRMRDAKIHQIWEGTNEINRIVIAGTLGAKGL